MLKLSVRVCCVIGLLGWSGLGSMAWAAQEWGQICNNTFRCNRGLACAGPLNAGTCLKACDAQNKCNDGAPCRVQPAGDSACFCRKDSECPSGRSCERGACVGKTKVGEVCDEQSSPCVFGAICTRRPGEGSTNRCYRRCKTACFTGEPCLASVGDEAICVCYRDGDCTKGTCESGQCQAPRGLGERCDDFPTCAPGLRCVKADPKKPGAYCLPICESRSCIAGEPCVVADNTKVCRCQKNLDCPGHFRCQNGLCIGPPRCLEQKDCPFVGQRCVQFESGNPQGLCLEECKSASTCSPENACSPVPNAAVKACFCRQDGDCQGGKRCVAYRCQPKCSRDNDCPGGMICKDAICRPEPYVPPVPWEPTEGFFQDGGSPDSSNLAEKPRGKDEKVADTSSAACQPACSGGKLCVNGRCLANNIGKFCSKNDECSSGYCFGPAPPAFRLCSPVSCGDCEKYKMACKIFDGQVGCYTPKPKEEPQGCGGCQGTAQTSQLWLSLLGLLLLVSRRKRRKNRSRT